MPFQLMYLSTASHLMSDAELTALLTQSRRFNGAHGLTGMLLYMDGTFMQVLEGEAAVVQELYAHIQRDPRHYDCRAFLQLEAAEREFAEWSMGFRSVTGIKPEQLPGFQDLARWHQMETKMVLPRGFLRTMLLDLAEANRAV